jgi:hypothetical protein
MAINEDEAASKISDAENAVVQAFKIVSEVEKVGVNASDLVSRLSLAVRFLAEAEIEYERGDLGKAIDKANQCLVIANDVSDDASVLHSLKLASAQRMFWLTLTFSSFGVVAFVIVLILVWGWFNRLYIKKLLKKKPEVV